MQFLKSRDGNVTVFVDGQDFRFNNEHPAYEILKQAIVDDDVDTFLDNIEISQAVSNYSGSTIEVVDGVVMHNGEPLHNSVTEALLGLIAEGWPFEPLARFLEKLMENPSKRSVEELYNFLEQQSLHLAEDGDFLAYKVVRENYLDKHSGTYSNVPGAVISMPRNQVNDDPRHGCSTGLHVGSYDYVQSFGSPGDKYLIVKVNPKDVVCVPFDCSFKKIRTCRYEVVEEYTRPMSNTVHRPGGCVVGDGWDDDYDDFDDYDEDEGYYS